MQSVLKVVLVLAGLLCAATLVQQGLFGGAGPIITADMHRASSTMR